MIKKYISRDSILYKPYLYYRMFWKEKFYIKRKTYSQCGEDKFIYNYFKKKITLGSYVDLGAFNPIKYSNTCLLFQNGWNGINIDLNQTSIDYFNIIRPNDINICAAIGNDKKKVKIYIESIFSPLNTISKNRSKNLTSKNIRKNFYYTKTKKFNDLIEAKFDFLNIDLEGVDFEVLKTINLNFYKPKLICIEVLEKKNFLKIKKYLIKFGYHFIKVLEPSHFFELRTKKNLKGPQ